MYRAGRWLGRYAGRHSSVWGTERDFIRGSVGCKIMRNDLVQMLKIIIVLIVLLLIVIIFIIAVQSTIQLIDNLCENNDKFHTILAVFVLIFFGVTLLFVLFIFGSAIPYIVGVTLQTWKL